MKPFLLSAACRHSSFCNASCKGIRWGKRVTLLLRKRCHICLPFCYMCAMYVHTCRPDKAHNKCARWAWRALSQMPAWWAPSPRVAGSRCEYIYLLLMLTMLGQGRLLFNGVLLFSQGHLPTKSWWALSWTHGCWRTLNSCQQHHRRHA